MMYSSARLWILPYLTTAVFLGMLSGGEGFGKKVDKVDYEVKPPPLDKEHVPKKCWNFTFGDWENMEFYSPLYPHNYPNNTECVTILVAPVGYMIELDFRDHFMMESANDCRYDFLEVRDGPYGYSPLIGRYCGRTFPPWIESTGNYMWIRFRSDDILQYSGFRAVYDYKVNPAYDKNDNSTAFSVCRIESSATSLDSFITYKDIPSIFTLQTEGRPLDCTWELRVPPHRKMLFESRDFRVRSQDDCAKNFLEVYDGTTLVEDKKKRYCVATVIQSKSKTNRLFIRIYGSSVNYMPKFKATYTTFVSGKCSKEYYDCGYKMCIDKELACNERPNCEDGSDEETCSALKRDKDSESKAPTHAIILGVIGGLFFTVVAISVCATCSARRKERHHRKAAKTQQASTQLENTVEMENLLKQGGTLPRNIPNGVLLKCGHATPTATPPEPASTSDLSTATVEIHCPHHNRQETYTPEPPHNLPDMLDYTVESGHYKRFPHMDYTGYTPIPVSEMRDHSPAPPSPISSINIPEPEFFKKYYLTSSIDNNPYMAALPANQLLGDPKLVVPQEGRMRYLTLPRLVKPIQGNGQVPTEICTSCEKGEMPEAPGQPYTPGRLGPRKSYINPERLLSTGHQPSGRFQIGRHNHPQSS